MSKALLLLACGVTFEIRRPPKRECHLPSGRKIIQQWLLGGALISSGLIQAAFYKRIRRYENTQAMAAPPLFRRLTESSNRSRLFFLLTRCVPLCVGGVVWIVWPFHG